MHKNINDKIVKKQETEKILTISLGYQLKKKLEKNRKSI